MLEVCIAAVRTEYVRVLDNGWGLTSLVSTKFKALPTLRYHARVRLEVALWVAKLSSHLLSPAIIPFLASKKSADHRTRSRHFYACESITASRILFLIFLCHMLWLISSYFGLKSHGTKSHIP